jgi:TRAP-type C4-dicarboxylate transport system permease small subunit
MKYIKGFFNRLDKVLEVWCVFITLMMTLLVIVSVFARYLFHISFIWSQELIIFVFIATTYFGIILCVLEKENIDIDFFKGFFNKKVQLVLEYIITIIVVATVLMTAHLSLDWISKVGDTLTSGMKIPYKFFYSMMPISFVLVAIYEVRVLVNKTKEFIDDSKRGTMI